MDALLDYHPVLNDRYRLLERVGSGGMAAVYKGQDLVLGRLVAIKVLHQGLTGDEEFLARFQKEAHAAANLSHPNIVTVHDIGQDDHLQFIVMEYVEGQTLKRLIRQYGERGEVMPISRALDFAIQLCNGIGYAHRAGLVHCDVKPQNMLVTPDDRIKVTDFGIARALSEASTQQEELVWGTPQYFSPEQAAGRQATPASDVYSIGVIVFEMLTGTLPFHAESHTALALKHLREEPPLVSDLNAAVPTPLVEIVEKVLAKEPSSRYATAGQFGRILSTYRRRTLADTGSMLPVDGDLPTQVQPRSADMTQPFAPSTPLRPVVAPDPAPETDWLAVVLGIIAFLALVGLIPLWYAVYLRWSF